jgi:hypothetical protein
MEIKKIYLTLIFILFIFGIIVSGAFGYFYGLRKVTFVTTKPVILPKEIFMRAGNVTKIEGNAIYLEAKILGGKADPRTGEVNTETLKITVNENTKINFPVNPREEIPTAAKFEDIKVGSQLYVLSLENIKNKKEFVAKEITILNYE